MRSRACSNRWKAFAGVRRLFAAAAVVVVEYVVGLGVGGGGTGGAGSELTLRSEVVDAEARRACDVRDLADDHMDDCKPRPPAILKGVEDHAES